MAVLCSGGSGGLNKFQQLVEVAALLGPDVRGVWGCLNRVGLPRSLLVTAGKAQRARSLVAGVRLPEVLDRGLVDAFGWAVQPQVGAALLPFAHWSVPIAHRLLATCGVQSGARWC